MPSENRVVIVGHLGRDPELKYTQNGTALLTLSVAASRKWKGRDGQDADETYWASVAVWGSLAEAVDAAQFRKGHAIHVEGYLRREEWQGKDGQKREATRIVAHHIARPIYPRPQTSPREDTGPALAPEQQQATAPSGDNIPF